MKALDYWHELMSIKATNFEQKIGKIRASEYLAIIVPTPSLVNNSNSSDPSTVPSMI
jgi:hypothetical protein